MKKFYLSLVLGLAGLSLSAQTTTGNAAVKPDTPKSKGKFTMKLPEDLGTSYLMGRSLSRINLIAPLRHGAESVLA
jgi:hypothetical protein